MPIFTTEEMDQAVRDTIRTASAPVGSSIYEATGSIIEPIVLRGDVGDGWIFTSCLCRATIQLMGLDLMICRCDPPDPDHIPAITFAMVPLAGDGTPIMEDVVRPDREPPNDVGRTAPEVVTFTRMMQAELAEDTDTSCAAWEEAVHGGWFVRVMSLAAKQAGEAQRLAVSARGVN